MTTGLLAAFTFIMQIIKCLCLYVLKNYFCMYVFIRDAFKKYKKINVTFVTSLILVRALMPKGDLD